MAGDRLRQPAFQIFSIECGFQQFKFRLSTFNEAYA